MSEVKQVIIDSGTGFCKTGFQSDEKPTYIFPTVVGYNGVIGGQNYFVGDDAQNDMLTLSYPISHGIVNSWDDMEKVWRHAYQKLEVAPEDHPVLLTESPRNDSREMIAQILFGTFNAPAIYVADQAELFERGFGHNTGTVLELGAGVSYALPIYRGKVQRNGIRRLDLGGRDITDQLMKIYFERGHFAGTVTERVIVRDLKETMCTVAYNYEQEKAQAASSMATYQIQGGRLLPLRDEIVSCPEMLFKPSLISMHVNGIHQMVCNAITSTDMEMHKELFGNIMVSGSASLIPGTLNRLKKELTYLAPRRTKAHVKAARFPEHSVWTCCTRMTSALTSGKNWLTKAEYQEYGAAIVHRKCNFYS